MPSANKNGKIKNKNHQNMEAKALFHLFGLICSLLCFLQIAIISVWKDHTNIYFHNSVETKTKNWQVQVQMPESQWQIQVSTEIILGLDSSPTAI